MGSGSRGPRHGLPRLRAVAGGNGRHVTRRAAARAAQKRRLRALSCCAAKRTGPPPRPPGCCRIALRRRPAGRPGPRGPLRPLEAGKAGRTACPADAGARRTALPGRDHYNRSLTVSGNPTRRGRPERSPQERQGGHDAPGRKAPSGRRQARSGRTARKDCGHTGCAVRRHVPGCSGRLDDGGRAAVDAAFLAHVYRQLAVGDLRLRARLRRVPAAGRPGGGRPRAPSRVPGGTGWLRRHVGGRRIRYRRRRADRQPLHQGGDRRVHRPGRAFDHPGQLRRGTASSSRSGRLLGHRCRWFHVRADGWGIAQRGVLAAGVLRPEHRGAGHPRGRGAADPPGTARRSGPSASGCAGRSQRDGGGAAPGLHPDRGAQRRLGCPAHHRLAGRRGAPAHRLRGPRAAPGLSADQA